MCPDHTSDMFERVMSARIRTDSIRGAGATCFSPLRSRFFELVVGMDKVSTRLRLVAFEAGGEIDIRVGLLVRPENAIFPFAIAQRVWVFAAPAGALLHDAEACHFTFHETPVGTFDGTALTIKLSQVPDQGEDGAARAGRDEILERYPQRRPRT
jgi:hypothetical protein